MTPRVPCLIPGCGHTCKKLWPGHEWLCGDHWRLVPMRLRAKRRTIRAQLRRLGEVIRLEAVIWRKMRAMALHGAAGI